MKRITLMFGGVLSLIFLASMMKSVPVSVDLTSKGIPVIVQAPEGSVIAEGILNGMVMDDITTHCWEINKGNFSLEVSMQDDDLWQSPEEYVDFSKEMIEMEEGFIEYVVSDANGYIAKLDVEGDTEYEFYHLLIKNDRAIEFATGLASMDYSLENTKKIYAAAKTAK